MMNNYSAEIYSFRNINLKKASPNLYYVNLAIKGEIYNWENNLVLFEKSLDLINNVINKDLYLKNYNVGKFVIVFPFGFVIYCFGSDEEIDSICVRYKEFEFIDSNIKEIQQVIPCPIEDKIKVLETELWFKTKSIKSYYTQNRLKFSIKNKYPNKVY